MFCPSVLHQLDKDQPAREAAASTVEAVLLVAAVVVVVDKVDRTTLHHLLELPSADHHAFPASVVAHLLSSPFVLDADVVLIVPDALGAGEAYRRALSDLSLLHLLLGEDLPDSEPLGHALAHQFDDMLSLLVG